MLSNPHGRGWGASALAVAMLLGSASAQSAELENNVAQASLSATSSPLRFTLDVPQGASDLNFQLSGGSGDADLYVRYGSAPTTSSYDCRPYLSGNNESCPVSNPQAGTYHVMLQPYRAFSGASLLASYQAPDNGGGDGGGDNGGGDNGGGGSGGSPDSLDESNLSGASGSVVNYTLDVPAGASDLSIAISGGSGDADLYVRYGAEPTTGTYDCRPYRSGNNESCSFGVPETGTYYVQIRGYSAYSGLSLTGSFTPGDDNGGGGPTPNQPPSANISNGPFAAEAGMAISMSSAGSSDSDGSIASYSWNFGDGNSSTLANPSHSYSQAGSYIITLTVTDDDGAQASVTSQAQIANPPASGFTVLSHYYDKGRFDPAYTVYETAFSDNYSDQDVEIHSYIVVNFSANVNASTLNSSRIAVKRLDMEDNAENNNNLINGSFTLVGPKTAIFKPNVEFYTNPNGTFDWNNPNWNGLKPNYRYQVSLSSAIRDTSGNALNTENTESSWVFETTDNDYGLYWFRDGVNAVKYVPGREMPAEYYNPAKPTLIFAHGWEKTSTNRQEGQLRDYRREPMTYSPGSFYPSQPGVDLVEVWKNPARNAQGKAWNVGVLYWNQFADDDYANLSKPQMAEAKIWSTEGKGGMRYAVRSFNGSSWSTGNTNISDNAPPVPVSVVLADALMSATSGAQNPEFRLTGHSLGNQMATAIAYIMKKAYAGGQISAAQFPKRLVLLDPYWRDGRLENNWTDNHPAYVDLGSPNDWPAAMTRKILEDLITFADNDPAVSFVSAFYDTSRTPDGSALWVNFGDRNEDQRDMMAIAYLRASWIPGNEGDNNQIAKRHVNGKYWYLWQYAFPAPVVGISASSTDAQIRAAMNYYRSNKVRYAISGGADTPTPADDTWTELSGSWQQ